MPRPLDQIVALFDPNRNGPRLAGFVSGVLGSLVLMALVGTVFGGGMSDTDQPGKQAYFIE